MRAIKNWLFRLIRPLFVANVDPSEDYECIMCEEPVLRRRLTCSASCEAELDLAMAAREVPDR